MTYQWLKDGNLILFAIQSSYTLSSVTPADAGNYSVRITNGGGTTTSSNATLTVVYAPSIGSQSGNKTVTRGSDVTLYVSASGSSPLSYQWQFMGSNIAGATDSSLQLNSIQLNQAGAYNAVVTNPWASATSSNAFITVTLPSYVDQPLASGLVLHLPFDTDLQDSSGRGNHGKPVGAPNLVPGFIGAGSLNPFTRNGTNNYVTLGTNTDFKFGTSTNFSVAFWARQPVGSWGGSSYYDPTYIANKDWATGGNVGWVLGAESPNASGPANVWVNYTEASPNTRQDYHSPAGSFGGNNDWHHFAVSFARGGNEIIYIDGSPIATNILGPGGTSLEAGYPVNIGNDGTGNYSLNYGYWTNAFGIPTNGFAMDDLGIWRRVLGPDEICAVYNQGLGGGDLTTVKSNKLTLVVRPRVTQQPSSAAVLTGGSALFTASVSGTTTLSFLWYLNGSPIPAATNTSWSIVNAQTNQAGNYFLVASNASGSATSSVATLTVNVPATIITQPASQVLYNGTNVNASFSVIANGTAPLDYQWFYNNVALAGATASSLTFTNVHPSDSGSVSVRVTNSWASVTSATASLLVIDPTIHFLVPSWTNTYNGTWSAADYLVASAVDPQGNVYVTGYAEMVATHTWDYVTIKYNSAGVVQWTAPYASPVNASDDTAAAMVVDGAGNVYVTGSSQGNKGWDYATVKYDSNGNQLWAARYDGPAAGDDLATALAVDANGNVFVTGSSQNAAKHYQFATIKYTSAGSPVWTNYYVGPGASEDDAVALGLDAAGNVYVSGKSAGLGSGFDYATIKYSNSGIPLWTNRYDGPGSQDDLVNAMAVDTHGNVYLTGSSYNANNNSDYATLKYTPAGALLWVARYDGATGKNDAATGLAVDGSGNIFVTGSEAVTDTKADFTTIKYNPLGQQIWLQRYDNGGDDQATALALDAIGNVYVVGKCAGGSSGYDVATIKYQGTDGAPQGVALYNSTGAVNDTPTTVVVDGGFNVYVGVQGFNPLDYVLLKYQPSYAAQYPPPVALDDTAVAYKNFSVTIPVLTNDFDPAGATLTIVNTSTTNGAAIISGTNIVFTAATNFFGTVVFTYKIFNGTNYALGYVTVTVLDTAFALYQASSTNYNDSVNNGDYLTDTAVDPQGNVYVTGQAYEPSSASYDYVTLKYGPDGSLLWRALYVSPKAQGIDQATALTLDNLGNVYVTGSSAGTNGASDVDYATVKYDPNGNQLWAARYNGTSTNNVATGIAVDTNYNVFVTGYSVNASGKNQYATLKYNSAGQQVWINTYVGPGASGDLANAIALDPSGNVFVTGQSQSVANGYDYATIKYSNSGIPLWTNRYNGPSNKDDMAVALAVDPSGNAYVTGSSINLNNNADFTTIKYGPNGNRLWLARYDGPAGKNDYAKALVVDNAGNVFVTGASAISGTVYDYATVKYNSLGQQLWVQLYDNGQDDQASAIALDPSGNVYVTGKSQGASSGYDFATIKYLSFDGTQMAIARFTSFGNIDEVAVSMSIDNNYNIYVGGQGYNPLAYVLVKYAPSYLIPSVVTVGVSNLTRTAATLNSSINPQAALTTTYFQYGLTTNYGSVSTNVAIPPGTNFIPVAMQIAGLTPGTLYHYRAVATNIAGSTFGDDATFTTLYLPPIASTLGASNVTSASALLNGIVNPQASSAAACFRFGVTTNYGNLSSTNTLPPGTNAMGISITVSGLTPGTLYHYSIIASNAGGVVTGQDLTFTLPVPPSITTQPQSQNLVEGQSLVWTTAASGNAPLSYQWYFNGSVLAGATASTFSLAAVQLSDAGDYSVVVTNNAGTASSGTATLSVMPRSSFALSAAPQSITATGGFSLRLSVPAGCTFVVQASSNLVDWTPLATNTASANPTTFTDPAAAQFPARYYRAMVQ